MRLWKGLRFIRNDNCLATPDSSNIDDKKKLGKFDTCFLEDLESTGHIKFREKSLPDIIEKSIDTFILCFVFLKLANNYTSLLLNYQTCHHFLVKCPSCMITV